VKFGVTGPDGNLWLTRELDGSNSTTAGEVDRVTPGGAVTAFTVPRPVPLGSSWSGSDNSGAIAVGPDGAMWFTDVTDQLIGRITTAGAVTEYTVSASPLAIVRGPDGALWFTDSGVARIGRITTSGVVSYVSLPGSGVDLTVGSDGNLWVSQGIGGGILRVTAQGSATRYPVPGAIGQTPDAGWLVTARDGNVWFGDPTNDAVGWISPQGDAHEYQVPGQYPQRSHWPAPDRLAVGPDGHIWFLQLTITLLTAYPYSGDELFRVE
jgi:virginiamycin B lyase